MRWIICWSTLCPHELVVIVELSLHDVKQVSRLSVDDEKVKLVIQHGKETITLNLYSDNPQEVWHSIKRTQNSERLRQLKEDRVERMDRGGLT